MVDLWMDIDENLAENQLEILVSKNQLATDHFPSGNRSSFPTYLNDDSLFSILDFPCVGQIY